MFNTTRTWSTYKNFLKIQHATKATKAKTTANLPGSGLYVEQIYQNWSDNPKSVHPSWDAFFKSDPYWNKKKDDDQKLDLKYYTKEKNPFIDHQNVAQLIHSYQVRGHTKADLDPLGISKPSERMFGGIMCKADEKVTRKIFEFDESDMEREFFLPSSTKIGGDKNKLKLKEIIERLEKVYCNKIGLQYKHLQDINALDWLKSHFEAPGIMEQTPSQKKVILERLMRAAEFEKFLAKKYPAEKRFGLEGCEVLIPCLKEVIDEGTRLGVESVVIGMAHRGRLNVLANVCRKDLMQILSQFSEAKAPEFGTGDVKYHLGTNVQRLNRQSNKIVKISMVANPSHLEAVNPVVQGKVRAEQFYKGDTYGERVMAILIHGDASYSGQGIVYESMHLSDLPCYTTFGVVHVVVNNQIGFTTDPRFSRSSPYCTDVAKVVAAPIFHVNADEPEAVVFCSKLATQFRQKFHKDVVLDLVCYRKNGHNEIDEPMFTQPLMYTKIRQMKNSFELYKEKLIKSGDVKAEEIQKAVDEYTQICNTGFENAKKLEKSRSREWLDSPWFAFFEGKDPMVYPPTGVKEEILQHIGTVFSSKPQNAPQFVLHKGIERVLEARRKLVEAKKADWSLGEAFAFGTLLKEGIHVRLSGMDVERGTFSHRHHVLHHQTIDKCTYRPLSALYPDQAEYTVCNSSLSENGVLSFEHGFSMQNPNSLVLWEAQFGDFVNNAQTAMDQYISTGETKWYRQCGMVLLLPHAMDGMGPEHSSCRIERFLTACNDDPDEIPDICDDQFALKQLKAANWIIANVSTPANLFHILRRQILLPFRKPLVIASPKSLLKLADCQSNFDEMTGNTCFKRLIPDCSITDPCKVKILIFCSGKFYYDMNNARKARGKADSVALIRIEQLHPLPYDLIDAEIRRYSEAVIFWVQEEHKNQGPWAYMQARFNNIANGRDVCYAGRGVAASPATGFKKTHDVQTEQIMSYLFGPKPPPPPEPAKSSSPDTKKSDKKP